MRVGRARRIGRSMRFGLDQRSNYLPTDEGGLILWVDMLDATAFTQSGGFVTQFKNKASNVVWTASAGTQPAYDATGLNGKPSMHPDGVDDTFISSEAAVASALDASTVAQPYTLIFVAQPDALDVNNPVLGAGNSGIQSLDTRQWGQNTQSTGRWAQDNRVHSGATNSAIYDKVPTALAPTLVTFAGQTNHTIQVNRSSPRTLASDPVVCTINRVALFCRPDLTPDRFWAGRLGELLLFNSILSVDAIGRAQDYLSGRWLQ